jgi:DNA (cytosine-5)-methyltransferase 1
MILLLLGMLISSCLIILRGGILFGRRRLVCRIAGQKKLNIAARRSNPVYPDMKLYEEILFLKHFSQCPYVVENVRPYYKALVEPSFVIGRHFFWSNKLLLSINAEADHIKDDKNINKHGFDLSAYKGVDKRKLYRNCTSPKTAGYILEKIFGEEYICND